MPLSFILCGATAIAKPAQLARLRYASALVLKKSGPPGLKRASFAIPIAAAEAVPFKVMMNSLLTEI